MRLDNLILNVKHVDIEAYNVFVDKLKKEVFTSEESCELSRYQKLTAKDYHYNLKVGEGDGAVYIGYQHNSEKSNGKGFTLKLETNPAKETKEQKILKRVFADCFRKHKKVIKGGDLALDVEQDMSRVVCYSKTGRHEDRHKGTRYFGNRGKHGYLKIYDKKKEIERKQGIEIDEKYLTRVEFSFRTPSDFDVTLQVFNSLHLDLNDLYGLSLFSEEKITEYSAEIKACIYSYTNGYQDLKDFTRTTKKKIKNALDSMESIDLDHAFQSAKKEIVKDIKSFVC